MPTATGRPLEVRTLVQLDPSEVGRIWADYERTFQQNARFNPCRQYYHREDFLEAMVAGHYEKIVGIQGGEIVFMVLVTTEFDKITWIEPAFYDHHWPELRDKRMYISVIYIRQDKKGSPRLFKQLIKSILGYMSERSIEAVFYDHGGDGPIQSLTDVVHFITGAQVLQPTGTQVYGGFLYGTESS